MRRRTNSITVLLALSLALPALLVSPGAVFASDPDPLFDDGFEEESSGFPDPLEAINRPILGFNRVMDKLVLNPITHVYGFIFPGPLKKSIRQAFDNAQSPPVIVNDLMQREWMDASVATARLLVNSTIGLGGLFDPAAQMGLDKHHSDFGQTLALFGVGSGPYIVFPVLGPTTLRHGTGVIADSLLSPTVYILGPGQLLLWYAGSRGIAAREEHMREIIALEASSLDYYAVLRSAFFQSRTAEIWERREHHRPEPETAKAFAGVSPPSQ